MIIYITGGERSGKSSFAQKLALDYSGSPVYIATSRRWDDDFTERIERHIADRDERWTSVEEETKIGELEISDKTVVIDCVTLWLNNLFSDAGYKIEGCLDFAKHQIDLLSIKEGTFIIISNELGMGVHASTPGGRKFVELQGWVNQYIASKSEKAWLMVSGIPMQLK